MAFRRNLRSRPNSESQGLGQCHLCCEQDSNEDLITCNICANQFHPIKCLLLSEWTLNKILDKSNSWSCNKCKSCEICRRKKYLRSTRCGSDKTLILCKGCDKGFHRSCIKHPKNTSAAVVEIGDDFYCRSCKKEGNFGKSDQKEDVGEGLEEEAGNNMDEEDEEDEAGEEDANMDDYQDADMEQDEPEDCSSSDETETTHVRQTRSRTAKTRGTQSAIKVKTDDDESDVVSTASDEAFAEADSKTNVKRKCAKRRRRGTKSGKTSSNAKKRILRTGGDEDDEDEILKNENDEERETTCPVPGCDSKGHLSGKYESHVTASTCPLFHNVDSESCVEGYQKRLTRKRFSEQMVKQSSKRTKDHSQLAEQRKKEISTILNQSPPRKKEHSYKTNTAREPMLKSLSPIFDFEMFREAQARAAELLQEQLKESNNKRSGIKSIVMGKYEVEVWYSSPYPEEYLCLPKLYICEFCLKYFNSPLILKRHNMKCPWHCPPGDEIYRKLNISIFEIDGEKNKFYCQNLCLLAKLFLDHKTLYYDVEPFKFYIMTECDSEGYHIIGYFSKEKNSFLNYNVSCILTFPPYQKQGYGRMLIDFSYLLTKTEGKVGSPEKPLSDLGLISYRSYWKNVILEYLCNYEGSEISIKDLSQETAINAYDIVSTLQALGMLKYWKGKHLVLTRKEILDEYRAKMKKRKNTKTIDPTCLHWQPAVPN